MVLFNYYLTTGAANDVLCKRLAINFDRGVETKRPPRSITFRAKPIELDGILGEGIKL